MDANKYSLQWFWKNFLSLGSALLLVLVIRSSLVEAFKIPSGSMMPTLLVGDQLFVNKLAYGLRVPLTDWIGDKPLYFFRTAEPARGDIIVFKYPVDPSIYLIKRVIGLPGDTLEMKHKVLYLNGKPFERTEVVAAKADAIFESMKDSMDVPPKEHADLFYQHFDHTTATVITDQQRHLSEDFAKITVPAGHYFCMGDNRDNSSDGRFWGFVPFENIKGKAVVVWLSVFLDFDHSKFTFNPARIGTILN
jgi:signal peptidase I